MSEKQNFSDHTPKFSIFDVSEKQNFSEHAQKCVTFLTIEQWIMFFAYYERACHENALHFQDTENLRFSRVLLN